MGGMENRNRTWDAQVPVIDSAAVMTALRAAGLPLSVSGIEDDESEADSERSAIVCVAAVREDGVTALVACPSGLVYRFEPPAFDLEFWRFAARFYYLVTGNLEDRRRIADLTSVPFKEITGRCLVRKKETVLSGRSLDDLLGALGMAQSGTLSLF